ncbi:MAG: response regulator [Dehalococcoidales bacterium]|nr:response regulator [Dehalococcoidales bacterium]
MVEKKAAKKKMILVVEDEVTIADICRRVLEASDFIVEIAHDGEKARQAVQKRKHNLYDLYIIDLRLPVSNGMDFYQWLASTHPESARRVIFTSGSAPTDSSGNPIPMGDNIILFKPFSIDELKTAVRETLRRLGE